MARKARSDGEQNLQKVLDAAELVFAQEGFSVPLALIAERAGVSRATIYRNFADREELAYAIFARNVVKIEEKAASLIGADRPYFELLRFLIGIYVLNVGLTQALTHMALGMDKLALLRKRTVDASLPLLRKQKEDGTIRPDIAGDDLYLLMDMFDGALGRYPVAERAKRGERVLQLAIGGLAGPALSGWSAAEPGHAAGA